MGLFKRGEFGSHDGVVAVDRELDNKYWDNEHGEQILGFIRESDKVEIVKKNGLYWIHFTCVLCIRYCYQQAKKLLKDKTKKVSVEIEVTDSKMREDGVIDIYDFNLGGVTILGKKEGRPVIEAIPGAQASVLGLLDEVALKNQKEVLCYAYQEMEGKRDIDNQKSNKEGKNVDENMQSELRELLFANLSSFTYVTDEGKAEYRFSLGEVFENHIMVLDNVSGKEYEVKYSVDENGGCKFDYDELKSLSAESCNSGDGSQVSAHGEGETCTNGENNAEGNENGESGNSANPEGNVCSTVQEVCSGCGEPVNECKCTAQLLACREELNSLRLEYEAICKELETCKASCDEYKAKCEEMSTDLESCKDYNEIKGRLESAEAKLFSIHCSEMKAKAIELMAAERLSDEYRREIETKCAEGKYSSVEELERDIGYATFKGRLSARGAEQYSSAIIVPPQLIKTENKGTQPDESRAQRIAKYAAGKNK